jgi:hypothetical protein
MAMTSRAGGICMVESGEDASKLFGTNIRMEDRRLICGAKVCKGTVGGSSMRSQCACQEYQDTGS